MLSDPHLSLARALDIPTFTAGGTTLYRRLTMVVGGAQISFVFYPIFPSDAHAAEVVAWLESGRAGLTSRQRTGTRSGVPSWGAWNRAVVVTQCSDLTAHRTTTAISSSSPPNAV